MGGTGVRPGITKVGLNRAKASTGLTLRRPNRHGDRRCLRGSGRGHCRPAAGRAQPGRGAAICVTVFGLGFGLATIARPAALLADRYGTTGYASIAGALTLPATIAKATAPLAAAATAVAGSYTAVMIGVSAARLLAAVALTRVGRLGEV